MTRIDQAAGTATAKTLVSVVIPAFNAEATLDETLRSVRAQSHRELEIIVVDDGSRDATVEVANAHAARDSRIHIIQSANGGVAAARNRGIAEAAGAFIAPVDADDLWRPTKIERQLRVMKAGGEEIGLAYCWSATIDENSIITSRASRTSHQGDILAPLLFGNFVGNGSSPLMRTSLVREAGGYDPSLRARKAQGCEDWKLYLLLAERSLFAVVPDHLVGYRYAFQSMSGDVAQMLRSDAIVRAEMRERHPDNAPDLDHGRHFYLEWLLHREVYQQNRTNFAAVLAAELGEKGGPRTRLRHARFRMRYLKRSLGKGVRPPRYTERFLMRASDYADSGENASSPDVPVEEVAGPVLPPASR